MRKYIISRQFSPPNCDNLQFSAENLVSSRFQTPHYVKLLIRVNHVLNLFVLIQLRSESSFLACQNRVGLLFTLLLLENNLIFQKRKGTPDLNKNQFPIIYAVFIALILYIFLFRACSQPKNRKTRIICGFETKR